MGRLYFHIGVTRVRARCGNAHAERRPWTFRRTEARERFQHLRARGLQCVDAQVDGCARCQCGALLSGAGAKGLLVGVLQPVRHIACDMERAIGRQVPRQCGAFIRGECAGAVLLLRHGGDGIQRKAPDILQPGECQGARGGLPHAEAQRVAAAQRVIDQRADGVAVRRACEAVGLAPVLQGLGGRAVALEDLAQHVDCRGGAACQAHGPIRSQRGEDRTRATSGRWRRSQGGRRHRAA